LGRLEIRSDDRETGNRGRLASYGVSALLEVENSTRPGELLKLGIDITKPSAAKYMVRLEDSVLKHGGRFWTTMRRTWSRSISLLYPPFGFRS